MDLGSKPIQMGARRLPRTRGDGPFHFPMEEAVGMAPPHTRGWTRNRKYAGRTTAGSPAHAGMDLLRAIAEAETGGLPRTRGDGPPMVMWELDSRMAPPHTRGWTARR